MLSQPLTTTSCLILSGLQVILYINEEEYNPFLVSSTGAKVIVHRQDEYPFIEDVGTEIETAMATSIGMHLVRGQSNFYRLREKHRCFSRESSEVQLIEESVGFKRQCGPVFPGGHPLVVWWLQKPDFVSSVRVNKDRMPFGERMGGIFLAPKTDTSNYVTCARCKASDTSSISASNVNRAG